MKDPFIKLPDFDHHAKRNLTFSQTETKFSRAREACGLQPRWSLRSTHLLMRAWASSLVVNGPNVMSLLPLGCKTREVIIMRKHWNAQISLSNGISKPRETMLLYIVYLFSQAPYSYAKGNSWSLQVMSQAHIGRQLHVLNEHARFEWTCPFELILNGHYIQAFDMYTVLVVMQTWPFW